MKTTILVNKNNSDYVNWQTDLLYHSFLNYHKNDKNLDFMAVVIDDHKPINCNYPFYKCDIQSQANINGDHYVIYDRAFSIKNFLQKTKSNSNEERLFLFLEADFVFLKPFQIDNKNNNTLGQKYSYMSLKSDEFCRKVISYYKNKINPSFEIEKYYKPTGWPFLIKESILSSVVDRWIELTIKFRTEDPENNPLYKNWICDMYGFNIALAEKMTPVELIDIMEMPPYGEEKDSTIFYHYCYKIEDSLSGEIIFDKRSYKPWNQINFSDNIKGDCRKLIEIINRYGALINENNCL